MNWPYDEVIVAEVSNVDDPFYRARQQRLAALLRADGLPGALVGSREHVQYLTGHRPVYLRPGAAWLDADGAITLAVAGGDAPPATVDRTIEYVVQKAGTLVDHAIGRAAAALSEHVPNAGKIGFDALAAGGACEHVSIVPALLKLRRTKDELEVRLLRQSIAGVEAIYAHIRKVIAPGMTEVDVCAESHAAAVRACGCSIGWLGNDFQSNSGGGPPRHRKIEAGELMPLDLGLGPNGYIADLCRTFCIGGEPTPLQRGAHRRILDVFDFIELQLRPGVACADLHQQAIDHLHGFEGLSFDHHLGHGIGLNAHESPRLNKNWNDVLAAGDVITIEPGLYGTALRSGIRIENDYLITEDGFERLSNCSSDL